MRVNKKAKTALWGLAIFSVVALFIFVAFVLADQLVYPSTGQGTNFSAVAQGETQLYNITINNTNIAGENITEIVIILNASVQINITDGTFNSSFGVGTSTNYSVNVSAVNINGGGLTGYIWFNATSDDPVKGGNFTLIMTANETTVYKNLTGVNINDTINIVFTGKSNASGTNLSQNYIMAEFNITNNDTGVTLEVRFFNSSQNIVAQTNITVVNAGELHSFNFTNITGGAGTGLPEGTYHINATVNNSQSDENVTATRTYILDTTAPTVTLAQDNAAAATTKTKITVDITISDANAGIGQSCGSTTTDASISGTGTSQTLTQESLACGTDYTYAITCTDTAGNSNAAVEVTATTSSCGGGGGPGGPSGTTWTNTFVEDGEELSVKGDVTKELREKHRVKLKIGGETHFVGILEGGLTETSATIQVSSEHEQEATLNIGETAKFDVLDDGFYDLSVTLGSIENDKASLTISPLHEEVVEEVVDEGADIRETIGDTVSDVAEALGTSKGVAWVLILVVIVVIILVIVYFVRKNREKVNK